MQEIMSVTEILNVLKKRWKIIIMITFVAVVLTVGLTLFVLKPVYEVSTQLLVNQKNSENRFDASMLQSNVDLINTYGMIIKSPAILGEVIKKLNLKESVEQINEKITITSKENSQVFYVTVEDGSPERAVQIANSVTETFQQEIKGIMNVDNVSILAKAELKKNPTPIRPKPKLNLVIAVFIGLMLGVGISFIFEFMDTTLKSDKDVAAYLGMPVLGSVQKMKQTRKKGRKESKLQNKGSETIVSEVK